jgi:hypothetical protein
MRKRLLAARDSSDVAQFREIDIAAEHASKIA